MAIELPSPDCDEPTIKAKEPAAPLSAVVMETAPELPSEALPVVSEMLPLLTPLAVEM
jgi:hypothetical protein